MRVEHNLKVAVEVTFLDEQSIPASSQFVFGYTVTLHNCGDVAITVLRRKWVTTTDEGMVQVTTGEGVAGETPCILVGQRFQYASFTVLNTPVGSMHGHYECELEGGERVMVKIPAFSLAVPGVLQ